MLTTTIDTVTLGGWYRRNRARSESIFDLIDPAAYYSRPISLRNPIVFYEGHLPAFSVLAFLRRGLGRSGVNARLERLFERGIDPDSVDAAVPRSGAAGNIDDNSLADVIEWFLINDERTSRIRHPNTDELFKWKQKDDEANGIGTYPFETGEAIGIPRKRFRQYFDCHIAIQL